MIADLKADSARWEADAVRRTNQGHPRGSYYHHDYHMHDYHHVPSSQGHNMHPGSLPPGSYAQSAPIHEPRQSQPPGPSPPPTYSAPPSSQPTYMDSYPPQSQYGASQTPPFSSPSYSTSSSYTVPHSHSPFQAGQSPYTPQTPPFTNSAQPAVSAEIPSSYKYQNSGYGFEGGGTGGGGGGWNNAPRTYPGGGYDSEQDYSPVTTGSGYPATTVSDHRIPPKPSMSGMNGMNGMPGMNGVPGMPGLPPMSGMDNRYPPESTFADRNRQQPPRDNRRPR